MKELGLKYCNEETPLVNLSSVSATSHLLENEGVEKKLIQGSGFTVRGTLNPIPLNPKPKSRFRASFRLTSCVAESTHSSPSI